MKVEVDSVERLGARVVRISSTGSPYQTHLVDDASGEEIRDVVGLLPDALLAADRAPWMATLLRQEPAVGGGVFRERVQLRIGEKP